MKGDRQIARNIRIGFLVSAALLILMITVFFIGSEQKVFAKKNEYEVGFDSVSGLAEGNPVKLSGVTIGAVKEITLPRDPRQRKVQITLMIDRKFAERIRTDSRARLKKLGLLAGDSYVDITPGSPNMAALEPGSVIPAQRQTDVDALMASGEELADNFVQISYSLKNILSRVDKGEGLLGELTTSPDKPQRVTDTLLLTLNKTNDVLTRVQSGKGLVGKLVYDDAYSEQITVSLSSAARSLDTIMGSVAGSFENNSGALAHLLSDPEGKRRVQQLLENLRVTSEGLATFSASLQNGQGLVPRLMNDQVYADAALQEFRLLISQLREIAEKLNNGEGTAARVINDPGIYESVNDILIGINESKLLRWLIRSRQQAGIEKRYEEQQKAPPASSAAPAPVAVPPAAVPPAEVPVVPPPASEQQTPVTPPTTTAPDGTAETPPASESPDGPVP